MAAEELVLGFAAGACGSLVLWLVVGRKLILKYAGRAVIASLSDPSDEMKEALRVVLGEAWKWFLTPAIKTGRTLKSVDEQGNPLEQEEILSPFQNLVQEIVRMITLKLAAMKGGEAKAFRQTLEAAALDPNNPAASSIQGLLATALSGRKGGSPIESLIVALIAKYLTKEGPGGLGGSGGQSGW